MKLEFLFNVQVALVPGNFIFCNIILIIKYEK